MLAYSADVIIPVIHAKRLQALLDVVRALLGERRLGLIAPWGAPCRDRWRPSTPSSGSIDGGATLTCTESAPVLLARRVAADRPHDPPADSGGLVTDR